MKKNSKNFFFLIFIIANILITSSCSTATTTTTTKNNEEPFKLITPNLIKKHIDPSWEEKDCKTTVVFLTDNLDMKSDINTTTLHFQRMFRDQVKLIKTFLKNVDHSKHPKKRLEALYTHERFITNWVNQFNEAAKKEDKGKDGFVGFLNDEYLGVREMLKEEILGNAVEYRKSFGIVEEPHQLTVPNFIKTVILHDWDGVTVDKSKVVVATLDEDIKDSLKKYKKLFDKQVELVNKFMNNKDNEAKMDALKRMDNLIHYEMELVKSFNRYYSAMQDKIKKNEKNKSVANKLKESLEEEEDKLGELQGNIQSDLFFKKETLEKLLKKKLGNKKYKHTDPRDISTRYLLLRKKK